MAAPANARKVIFDLDVEDGYPPVASEGLWATPLDSGDFRIDNIPFYVPGLALGDTVSVEEEDGILYGTGVVEQAGHSTVRVVFFDAAVVDEVRAALVVLGCGWENMKDATFTAVDVPPEADYDDVVALLSARADADQLDFEESCIQH
ncbi:MAG: DUF4265 domain-containing protein [Proteobacteria bacterium]|uniref:DUF4265 domain-containing protein n=1 Tax=Aquabacterium sp. TaxID=1872578 RepID=UPI0035C6C589|nr:DUF4265 domain-containing protein [Pseudomonadota bacterium]